MISLAEIDLRGFYGGRGESYVSPTGGTVVRGCRSRVPEKMREESPFVSHTSAKIIDTQFEIPTAPNKRGGAPRTRALGQPNTAIGRVKSFSGC